MSTYMKEHLRRAIGDLRERAYVQKDTLNEFSKRVEIGEPYTKAEHVPTHICSFFIPYHVESHSIFVVHHRKANDWR